MAYDLYSSINPIAVIEPVVIDEDLTEEGHIVDMFGYESVVYVITTGDLGDPGGDFVFFLQESDVNEDEEFTAVPASFIQSIFPHTDTTNGFPVIDGTVDVNKIYKVGYLGIKRYLRLLINVTGTTGTDGLPISIHAIQSNPIDGPTPRDLNV